MQAKLAQFIQAFAGFALRSGHDNLFLHVPLYGRMAEEAGRTGHAHVHFLAYRYRSLVALYVAAFKCDTRLVRVQPEDWQVFGPYTESSWLESGAEEAVAAALTIMHAQLGGAKPSETRFLIPARQFPQIFTGLPIDLENLQAAQQYPQLNLS